MADFELLPDELLLLILGQLDPKSLSRVKEWSTYWKSFVECNASELWSSVLRVWAGVCIDGDLRDVWKSFQRPDVPEYEESLCLRFHCIYSKFGSTGFRMVRIFDRLFRWLSSLPQSAPKYHFLPPVQDFPEDQMPPTELRALYSLTGGQRAPSWLASFLDTNDGGDDVGDVDDDEEGIFGSTEIYDCTLSMGLMPWQFHEKMTGSGRAGTFLLAANFRPEPNESPFQHVQMCVHANHHLYYNSSAWPRVVDAVSPDRWFWGLPTVEVPPDMVHHPEIEDVVASLGYTANPVYPLVHWLESYVEQLESGNYCHRRSHRPDAQLHGDEVLPEGVNERTTLVRFPTQLPNCHSAVTNGIEIKVAASPQLHLSPRQGTLVWGYEVTMRLLSVQDQAAQVGGNRKLAELGGPLNHVQLTRRFWRITSPEELGGQEVEGALSAFDVRLFDNVDRGRLFCGYRVLLRSLPLLAPRSSRAGPGVVGHRPILQAGKSAFSYCSLTHVDIQPRQSASQVGELNWMEGYFTFEEVDVGVASPKSKPKRVVRATVPRFHLRFPDVIL